MGRGERVFLHGAWAVIAATAAVGLWRSLANPPPIVPLPPEAAPASPPELSAPPPAEPVFGIVVEGKVVDLPGLPVDPGILRWTRTRLCVEGRPVGEGATPSADGSFRLENQAPLRSLALRLTVELHFHGFDRLLSRDIPLRGIRSDLGELPLPRSPELGRISGKVVDAAGHPLRDYAIAFDAVEGGSTPDIGLAKMGAMFGHAANAPVLYRQGPRFTILHIPPGEYRLHARVVGRYFPALRIAVGSGEAEAVLAEQPCRRRLLGSVRDALGHRPLADAEISLSTADFAGPATQDPLRLLGRTSIAGLYDLPLPDALPPGGLTVTVWKERYRGTDFRLREEEIGADGPVRRDLDLGRE